jgi:hypothetical protein
MYKLRCLKKIKALITCKYTNILPPKSFDFHFSHMSFKLKNCWANNIAKVQWMTPKFSRKEMRESKRKTISIDVYSYTTNLEVLIVVLNNNPNNLNTSK